MKDARNEDETAVGAMRGKWWVPRRGFSWHLRLHEDPTATFHGPWLVPNLESDGRMLITRYAVLRRPTALEAFLALSGRQDFGIDDGVLGFANAYGWLGVAPGDGRKSGFYTKPYPGTEVTAPPGPAEPIDLWYQEVRQLAGLDAFASELRAYQAAPSAELNRRRLAAYFVDHRGPDAVAYRYAGGRQAGWFPVDWLRKRGDLAERATVAIEHEIERKLNGRMQVHITEHRTIAHAPDSLLAALYLQFLSRFLDLGPARKVCQHCGQEYQPRRSDQLFCSTRCYDRHYYRTRRASQSTGRKTDGQAR